MALSDRLRALARRYGKFGYADIVIELGRAARELDRRQATIARLKEEIAKCSTSK